MAGSLSICLWPVESFTGAELLELNHGGFLLSGEMSEVSFESGLFR